MKTSFKIFSSLALALVVVTATVHAQTTASTSATTAKKAARLSAQVTRVKTQAGNEIARRIEQLNKVSDRLGEMKKLSDTDKSTLVGQIKSQVDVLTALKTKIDADTDATTLKEDQKSITTSYRIYALILPRLNIIAAADRASTVADQMAALATKIQSRVAELKTAGKDTSSLDSSLTDYNAKIAEIRTQAQAAVSLVAPLNPDNGDKTVEAANTKALKDARADIKNAETAIKAAQKTLQNSTKALKTPKFKMNASATASSTSMTGMMQTR